MRRLILLLWFLATLLVPCYFVSAVKLGGLDTTAKGAGIKASSDINDMSGKVLAPVLSFVGVIFFILLLYAGTLWMTAMGDEKKIEQAKKIILAAAIGLFIVAAAYSITRFVGQSLISPTTTTNTP